MSFKDFDLLSDMGVEYKESVTTDPKDEFFHSLYIAGKSRKNEEGIVEKPDMLQIRGIEYNKDEVHIVTMHVKKVLVKNITENKREKLECFSYKEGTQWKGTSGRVCGINSGERAQNDYCKPCREQLIVSGVYCTPEGKPIVNSEGKPIFLFIRGKGTKYSNISSYLNDMYMKEFEPVFTPPTAESLSFEKRVVNPMRVVTKISIGFTDSAFGQKTVFELTAGNELDPHSVMEILKITKKTKEEFDLKMDWSKKKSNAASGYGDTGSAQQIPDPQQPSTPPQPQPSAPAQPSISFDDLNF
jgi:hypothetical protein